MTGDFDAVVAAPDHHRVVMENDRVRMLETVIRPGERVPMHTHQWPSANYFLSWSDMVRRDGQGTVTFDSRQAGVVVEPGQGVWNPPFDLHTLENVGDGDIHVITVELKN